MHQSIPGLTIPPPWNFLKGRIPHPPRQKESTKPRPMGQKNHTETPPRAIFFKNPAKKNTKHEIEIMKNSTEMLICLEILKR